MAEENLGEIGTARWDYVFPSPRSVEAFNPAMREYLFFLRVPNNLQFESALVCRRIQDALKTEGLGSYLFPLLRQPNFLSRLGASIIALDDRIVSCLPWAEKRGRVTIPLTLMDTGGIMVPSSDIAHRVSSMFEGYKYTVIKRY